MADEVSTFPWPPREGEPFADAAVRTWRESLLRPTAFFRAMPPDAKLGGPLLFYLMVGLIAQGITLFWDSVLGPIQLDMDNEMFGPFMPRSDPLADFLLSPVILLLLVFVGGAVTHLMLKMLGGARRGFRATVAVLCYSEGPALLSVIPRIGMFLGIVGSVVLVVIGLREAHQTTTFRAVAALLLPALLLFGFVAALLMVAVFAATLLPATS